MKLFIAQNGITLHHSLCRIMKPDDKQQGFALRIIDARISHGRGVGIYVKAYLQSPTFLSDPTQHIR
jgi:hypothetical protein